MNRKISTKTLTTVALLLGITIVLANTPLGFIPVGPIFATTLHIPVILAAVLMGPKIGALMGLFFGCFSMFRAFTMPTATSFIFMDPLVSVLPRVIMGYFSGLFYQAANRIEPSKLKVISIAVALILLTYAAYGARRQIVIGEGYLSYLILILLTCLIIYVLYRFAAGENYGIYLTAALGTALNTVGVLGMVYILHAKGFMEATGRAPELALKAVMGIAVINGIPEIIVATVLVSGIAGVLIKHYRGK